MPLECGGVGSTKGGQARDSVAQNSEFFSRPTYGEHADALDSHRNIRAALTRQLSGARRLLDVGSGGVFEYDPGVVEEIVAVDLFLDEAAGDDFPDHVQLRRGDALSLSEPEGSFDVVLQAFLFHHLTGERASDSVANTRRAISEAVRMLAPGGTLVIAESCLPAALYPLERAAYPLFRRLASRGLLGGHPATLQLPIGLLTGLVAEHVAIERCERIELGRYVTQFGRRFPTALTPVRAYLIVGRKG